MAGVTGTNPLGSGNPANPGGTGGSFQVREGSGLQAIQKVGSSIRPSGGGSGGGPLSEIARGLMTRSHMQLQHEIDMVQGAKQHEYNKELNEQVLAGHSALSAQQHEQDTSRMKLEHRQTLAKNRQAVKHLDTIASKHAEPGTKLSISHGGINTSFTTRKAAAQQTPPKGKK